MTLRQRLAGLSVHAFTASGAVLGFLALLAALDGDFSLMFLWLLAALVVDTVDGTIARHVDVKRTAARFSGDSLDLVVDYITYVLVPAFAMYRAGLMPHLVALPLTAMILLVSALYFADTRMKTEDWYFRGFPAAWNLFAFLAFVLRPDPWVVAAFVVLFCGLTFAPVLFIHPLRVSRLRMLNIGMLAVTAVLFALSLWWQLEPPVSIRLGLSVVGGYFLLVGLLRPKP